LWKGKWARSGEESSGLAYNSVLMKVMLILLIHCNRKDVCEDGGINCSPSKAHRERVASVTNI
jgi:hypothetical protein